MSSVTNLFLGRAAPLLLWILSLRLVDDTNKNSCIERSLFVCNAFAHREWSTLLCPGMQFLRLKFQWTWRRNQWNWPKSRLGRGDRLNRSDSHLEQEIIAASSAHGRFPLNIRNLYWMFGCKFFISPDNPRHFYILMIFIAGLISENAYLSGNRDTRQFSTAS